MDKKEKLIGSIIMIIGCTIFLVVGYILSKPNGLGKETTATQNAMNVKNDDNKVIVDNSKAESTNNQELKNIVVEIKGEVKNPSVYTLSYGSRIYDLVEKAGGFTDKADTMSVNSSMKLRDEDCIIIYSKDKNSSIDAANNAINIIENKSPLLKSENGKLNLNTATKEELMSLPGVGEVTAQKILDYREEKGGFTSIDELKNISRIGDKTIEKFKDEIEIR